MIVSSSEPPAPISQLGNIKEVFFALGDHGKSAAIEVRWGGRNWKIKRRFEDPQSDEQARVSIYQHLYEHLVKKGLPLPNNNSNQVSESNKPETNLVFNLAYQTTSQILDINNSAASSSASKVIPDQLLAMAKIDIFFAESKLEQSRAELSSNINTLSEAQQTDASNKLAQIEEMIQYARLLKADKFKPEVIQKLIQYRLMIREAGISSQLPQRLAQIDYFDTVSGKLWDDDGKLFGNVRIDAIDIDTVMSKFRRFCYDHGGDYALIRRWHADQGKASWSFMSCQVKQLILNFREVDRNEYFTAFLSNTPSSDPALAKLEETLLMNMALVMEFLTHTELPGINKVNGTITIFRSETAEVIETANIPHPISPSDKENQFYMKRGPAEAGSLISSVLSTFRGITIQEVPYHRIISTYVMEPFLRDDEKEFICIFEGIPFKYLGIKGVHC